MSKIPQKHRVTQADEAPVAHSANREKAPLGGDFVDRSDQSTPRSIPPIREDKKQEYSQEYLLGQIDSHWKTQKALSGRIEQLEREKADLRALVDRATAHACEWQEQHTQVAEALSSARQTNITLQETCSAKVAAAWERAEIAENRLAGSTDAWNKATREVAHLNKVVERQAHEISEYRQMCGSLPAKDGHLLKRTEAAENKLAHWKERALAAEQAQANLAAQVEALAAQLEEQGAAQVEAQAARIAVLEADLAQAHTIVEDLTAQYRELGNTNSGLLARIAELEEQPTLAGECQACAAKDARIRHLEGLHQFDAQYTARLQQEERWDERKSASPAFEPATKEVVKYVRKVVKDKGSAFTPIYRADVAKAVGLSEQAAGRHLNIAVASGLFSAVRTEEKALVPDARLGQREITKKVLNLAATALLDRPEEWERGDGKEHGGARRFCKSCHSENTLRTIPHTVCLECGHEDVWYPDDARIALDRARTVQAEDAPAAVAEADWIVSQQPAQDEPAAAPVSDIQDENQSQVSAKADPMALARAAGFPALVLEAHGVQIAAGSSAWSRWMHMSRPTPAAISAVIEHFKGKPAPFDTPCEWCGSTETVWDPDGSGRRVTACFVSPERRKTQGWEVTQAAPVQKTIDFASGEIVEVRG